MRQFPLAPHQSVEGECEREEVSDIALHVGGLGEHADRKDGAALQDSDCHGKSMKQQQSSVTFDVTVGIQLYI